MEEKQYTSLVTKKENMYFTLLLIVSSMVYLFLTLSIVGILIILTMFLIATISHGLFIGHIRANGVKLSSNQFKEIFEKAKEISEDMGLKTVPDIYVIESSGILNALATRFFGKNMVILYSDIFDLINQKKYDELHFILAHELAHIKRNHILKNMLLLPSNFIPFLSEAYSRACEYTCDRMAAAYIQNTQSAINSLLILSIGKQLFDQVNKEEYIQQIEQENGLFVWLSEKLSTHPPLPKRIIALETFVEGRPAVRFKSPILKIVGFAVAIYIGLFLIILLVMKMIDSNPTFAAEKSWFSNWEAGSDLEIAYFNNDLEWTKELLEEGEDPSLILPDSNDTLVHLSIAYGEPDFLELYLQYVDPNIMNGNGEGLLHYAGYYGYYDMIPILIESGANVNLIDHRGNTPLYAATMNGGAPLEILHYMLENGADPMMPNKYGDTPLMYAKQNKLYDIVELYESYSFQ